MNNKKDGLLINNFSNVQIWNNTIIGNARPIWLAQDNRRNNNRSDPAVDTRVGWPDPEMPWQLEYVTLGNNVLGNPASGNALLCVEDYTYSESAEAMHIVANGNVYNRASTSSPSWLSIWTKGSAGANTFTSLAALKSTTGQEARGREYTGAAIVDSNGVLTASVSDLAPSVALPLPSAVALASGRSAGTTSLGAWTSAGGGTTTPTPTPTPTPTTPSTAVASDGFDRTVAGSWGTSDKGGAWSLSAGSSQFSVSGGIARMELKAGDGFEATLPSVSSSATNSTVFVALSRPATGDGQFISLIGRVKGTSQYMVKIRVGATGQVTAWLTRVVDGTATVIAQATPSAVLASGNTLALRLQVTGTSPTTIRAKVWQAEKSEPSDWTVNTTDNASQLQAAGSVGLWAYASGNMSSGPMTVFFDSLNVTAP